MWEVPEMFVSLEELSLLLDCRGQGQIVIDVLLPMTLHNHITFSEWDDFISHYLKDSLFSSFVHQIWFSKDPCEVTQRESQTQKLKMEEVQ